MQSAIAIRSENREPVAAPAGGAVRRLGRVDRRGSKHRLKLIKAVHRMRVVKTAAAFATWQMNGRA